MRRRNDDRVLGILRRNGFGVSEVKWIDSSGLLKVHRHL